MPTVHDGMYISRYAFWNPETWSIPALYWDTFSQEQRIHAICRELSKVIQYADYLGVNVDDIAARLKAIEDGQLDDFIVEVIEQWFNDNQPAIIDALDKLAAIMPYDDFESAGKTIKQYIDDANDAQDNTISGLQGDIISMSDDIDDIDDRLVNLEKNNFSYSGWAGWEVLLNNNAFSAGKVFAKRITEKNHFASSPANYNYSETFYVSAPMPFNNLQIAGTTDRNLQTIVNANPQNNVGFQFQIVTPWDYDESDFETGIRLVLVGLVKKPPENAPIAYNAVIGQQIANLALTYYDAMINGREFSYGRNFFYQSLPNDIINDSNGRGRMECDTFVGMVLRGIPYEISPYCITTPDYRYDYEDLYTDVSGATNWAANTPYALDDIVLIDDYYYYKCIQAHTSASDFQPQYWKHVWISNPYSIAWATSENADMHPANKYLDRDILYAGDIGFLGWLQERVFSNVDEALTGDVAVWVRRGQTPTYWGGFSAGTAFDNIGHVGIVYIDNGQKYILHVTTESFGTGTVVNKTPIEDFGVEQPAYYYRPLYS